MHLDHHLNECNPYTREYHRLFDHSLAVESAVDSSAVDSTVGDTAVGLSAVDSAVDLSFRRLLICLLR